MSLLAFLMVLGIFGSNALAYLLGRAHEREANVEDPKTEPQEPEADPDEPEQMEMAFD